MSVASTSRNPSIQWAPELHREHSEMSDDEEGEDSYYEDWNKTTSDKDSFAAQHLRRTIGGLKWNKINNYPSTAPIPSKERAGSILSAFEVGHQDGVPLVEDPAERAEYERKRRASSSGVSQLEKIENYPQLQKEYLENRQGSVLSAFTKNNQHFDDAMILPEDPANERRNSTVGIEKIENYPTLSKEEREKRLAEGRHGSILGVFADDHEEAANMPNEPKERRSSSNNGPARPVIENYPQNSHKRTMSGASALEVPQVMNGRRGSTSNAKDRRGSVLSLWTDNSDDHEYAAHEYEDVKDKDSDRISNRSSNNGTGTKLELPGGPQQKGRAYSGTERHGSILSMWTPGKHKNGDDVIGHGDDFSDDEDEK
ncbi:hypothetical protein BP6252_11734 [Coleophoma cylindrospora]|uniref:Uncharacterized protein n=1 Tax=Coleophoma cylindrospora TaxID=1849047 RepID=A0A3D8QKQ7_9HELO|nr:hypothetical protein BP6252_11734 [Coleophoma cylindrospora]